MAQFDIHRNAAGAFPPYLVCLSNDLLAAMATIVVAPLVPLAEVGHRPLPKFCPIVEVDGETCVLMTLELAGVSPRVLGPRIATLADRRNEIIAALDFLFTGI